jgi:hypothetical protein
MTTSRPLAPHRGLDSHEIQNPGTWDRPDWHERHVRLTFCLRPDELSDSSLGEAPSAISSAIRADFARRCETAEHHLVRTRLNGCVSLLVGLVVLLRLMSLVEAVHGFAPPGSMATMLQEGFTIVAWVALWRPAELLLFTNGRSEPISRFSAALSPPRLV